MANPQPNDPHLIFAHSLEEAIMMRDFTKHRRKILDLILRLSWGCGKNYAHIPHQRDFEVAGVHECDIKREIEWLEVSKIIFREGDYYWFNKDFDQWQISRINPFNPEKLRSLLNLNLKSRVPSEDILETHPKLKEFLSTKQLALNDLLNENLYETQNKSFVKGKTNVLRNTKNLTPDLATAKESIKERLKKDTTTTDGLNNNLSGDDDAKKRGEFFKLYEQEIGMITPFIAEDLKVVASEYSLEWFKAALEETRRANVRNLSYPRKILERWKVEGFMSPRKGRPGGGSFRQAASDRRRLPTAEELQKSWGTE